MWDRKTEPAPNPPSPQAAAPVFGAREAAEPSRRGTEIGGSISIIGEIYSEEDL